MGTRWKTAVAAGFVGAVAVAATAFGQTGSPSPSPDPERQQRRLERRADGERGECGKPGPRVRRAARRLVHSETKLQVEGGFALVVVDTGTITAIDHGDKSLTIERADGVDVTVTAQDGTKICKDGAAVAFDKLKAGDRAGITRVTRDGTTRVRAIRAHTPSADAETPARPALGPDFLDDLGAA